jgi:signal transduction histidine kinase
MISRPSSLLAPPARRTTVTATTLGLAALLVGLTGERIGSGFADTATWVPDLLVGLALVGAGLAAVTVAAPARSAVGPRSSVTGMLLVAAGLAWFLPNFGPALNGRLATAAIGAVFVHRAPLVHATLIDARGRSGSPVVWSAIGFCYLGALFPALWLTPWSATTGSALVVAAAGWRLLRTAASQRSAALVRSAAATALALVFEASALRPAGGSGGDVFLSAYESTVVLVAVGLVVSLATSQQPRALTDLVVELGEGRVGGLHARLVRAVGDPTLDVGYWAADIAAYVDENGSILRTAIGDDRATTRVDRDGTPVAVLVHDPALLGEPRLLDALGSLARLAGANARLHAELRAQVSEVEASRRRIVAASDVERARLEVELRTGTLDKLDDLAGVLAELAPARIRSRALIDQARQQLDRTREDLLRLARGIHPRALETGGLRGALSALAADSVVPVDLACPELLGVGSAEVCVYFVCAEAVSNAVKHADATRVAIAVTARADGLQVDVQDDGRGGADTGKGTGLRGLADRVEALGGTIRLLSPLGGGTRLSVFVPGWSERPRGPEADRP